MPRDADQRQIKSAYRRLAREHHPDLNPDDPAAEEQFKRVLAAFHVLSDPTTRQRYDDYGFEGLRSDFNPRRSKKRTRHKAQRPDDRPKSERAASSADTIFAEIFNGRSPLDSSHMNEFGGFDTSLERGQDLSADLTVDFLSAVRGGAAKVRLPNRSVTIDIPAGIADGQTLELRGRGGEPASEAGIPGDLSVTIHVSAHPLLRRDGLDLYLDVPLTVAEAVNGAEITIPTPHGSMEVEVPAGVHTGTKLRLAGQGVRLSAKLGGPKEGDFFAVMQVYTPDYVDDEIRDAAETLTRGYSEDVRRDLEL